jgi:phospholipase/carboxylesterase
MLPMPLSLTHLLRPPAQNIARPPLLVLLHDVGGNEGEPFVIASQIDPRFLVLSVRAPLEQAANRFAWYEVAFTPERPVIDPGQASASLRQLLHFLDEAVLAYGADPRQVYLMGFSQGAVMCANVALTAPERVAGVVLMSGRILPEITPLIADRSRLGGLPILVLHGLDDDVLPIGYGRATQRLLDQLQADLQYQEYPIGHEVQPQSLADALRWLSERLDDQGAR